MTLQCGLCPKQCVLEPGQSGECRIRINRDDQMVTVTYGFPSALHVDPVEKKPLFHFLPGSRILSLATVGCNLHCKNCQNWELSQRNPEDARASRLPPRRLPALAKEHGCRSVAYTYSEPFVFYEYTTDCSIHAAREGLKNVLVTAAYANERPWRTLCRRVDAANIDLKAFSDQFYRDVCDASLAPVLRALVAAREEGVLVEVTNLVIPTLNDSDRMLTDLARWISRSLGADTPLHFSRFTPRYRMRHLPSTPPRTLRRAREIARAEGLHHVYIGNLLSDDAENTTCPRCGRLLIRRRRYTIMKNDLQNGACPDCGREIYGLWS